MPTNCASRKSVSANITIVENELFHPSSPARLRIRVPGSTMWKPAICIREVAPPSYDVRVGETAWHCSQQRRQVHCFSLHSYAIRKETRKKGPTGGCTPNFWVGVCRTVLKTLTLFQTKIYDFSYPFSDLTPKTEINEHVPCQNQTLFQTKKAKPYPISD